MIRLSKKICANVTPAICLSMLVIQCYWEPPGYSFERATNKQIWWAALLVISVLLSQIYEFEDNIMSILESYIQRIRSLEQIVSTGSEELLKRISGNEVYKGNEELKEEPKEEKRTPKMKEYAMKNTFDEARESKIRPSLLSAKKE
jgi:hypothetical protein